MKMIETAKKVFETEIEGVEAVMKALDASFEAAVERLLAALDAGGKIVVTGVGKNVYIGEKMSATLASTGSTSVFLNPTQALHGDLGILAPHDVLVALSYSGESDEIRNLLPAVRRLGIPVVGMTSNPESTLGAFSDVVLSVAVPQEACSFGMVPTASTTATLALCDAVAMALMEAHGFTKENFALYHPAGAIGKALLTKVADIMRKGDGAEVARVSPTATVRDAILAMTEARAGCCCVVSEAGVLEGIFTDGDFRRYLASTPNAPLDAPVAPRMTPRPIHVLTTQLAVDALRVFEAHRIDDLPVLGPDGLFAGTIDIQDLPKFKVL